MQLSLKGVLRNKKGKMFFFNNLIITYIENYIQNLPITIFISQNFGNPFAEHALNGLRLVKVKLPMLEKM